MAAEAEFEGIETDAEAVISGKYYLKLEDALAAVKNNVVVVINKDFTTTAKYTCGMKGVSFTIDLNNKTHHRQSCASRSPLLRYAGDRNVCQRHHCFGQRLLRDCGHKRCRNRNHCQWHIHGNGRVYRSGDWRNREHFGRIIHIR